MVRVARKQMKRGKQVLVEPVGIEGVCDGAWDCGSSTRPSSTLAPTGCIIPGRTLRRGGPREASMRRP